MDRHADCPAFTPDARAPTAVCIVDDDPSVRKSLSNLLRSAGIETLCFPSGESFLAAPEVRHAGCALIDLKMSGLSGADVQRELVRSGSRLPVICMSAHWDESASSECLRLGAIRCLSKPFTEDALLAAVEEAVRR